MVIQAVNRAVQLHQGHGGLFTHPLDTGDVVAGIPHQGFQVDNVDGVKAILLPKGGRGHVTGVGAAHAGGHQLHCGGVCH